MPITFGEYSAQKAFLITEGQVPTAVEDAVLVVEPADDGTSRVASGRFTIAPGSASGMSCGNSETMLFEIEGVGLLKFQIVYSGIVLEGTKTFYQFELASRPEVVEG